MIILYNILTTSVGYLLNDDDEYEIMIKHSD